MFIARRKEYQRSYLVVEKSEIRISNPATNPKFKILNALVLEICVLNIGACFEFRASDLGPLSIQ
ncbi:MAG: hypothetical protein A2162_06715 [Deltaproteobacteria bacterium RBG_13_52_11b]|nr:MAG: hypothetical protein A2162_06715 [Deltaproteobacteria bacterium RBG_13_52_11b]